MIKSQVKYANAFFSNKVFSNLQAVQLKKFSFFPLPIFITYLKQHTALLSSNSRQFHQNKHFRNPLCTSEAIQMYIRKINLFVSNSF